MKSLIVVMIGLFAFVSAQAGYQFYTGDQPDTQGIAHYEWSADGGATVTVAAMEVGSVAGTVKMVATPTVSGAAVQARACIAGGECGPWSAPAAVLPGQPSVIIQWTN